MAIKNMQKYQQAERKATMLRAILYGADGSGKTMTALEIMRRLVGNEGDILVVDTESAGEDAPRSGQYDQYGHYIHPLPYKALVSDPKTVYTRFTDAVSEALESGAEAVIVDSFTDENLAYLMQAQATGQDKQYYKDIKPMREKFYRLIGDASCHLIVCLRAASKGVFDINPNTGKQTIVRMAEQPLGSDEIGFSMNLRVAMEATSARIVKTIYPEIPDGAVYHLSTGDESFYEQIRIALDNGLVTKERFKFALKQRGYPPNSWKQLWQEIPELGDWSTERHQVMLNMVDKYLSETT
jgi:hypothetical protein